MQVDKPDGVAGADFPRFGKNVPFPPQAQQVNDFPCALVASPKNDMLFLLTKAGYMYMYFIPPVLLSIRVSSPRIPCSPRAKTLAQAASWPSLREQDR